MSEDLSSKASFELEYITNYRKAVDEMEEIISTTDGVSDAFKRAAREGRNTLDMVDGIAKATADATTKNKRYAESIRGAGNAGQKDAHVQAFEARNKATEAASKQTALYNQYLYDEQKALDRAAASQGKHTESIVAARYALYDVSTTLGIASAALLVTGAATATMAAKYETAFTAVQRTSEGTNAQVEQLRGKLGTLSTTMPISFEQISAIATLGNQLGIASEGVESFTQTSARFAAVTGITAEASATAFGSLGELLNLTSADYENLGSAIAYVGRTSVATEPEIIALATRLAASATSAGFTAQEVIALSGAFASLRIAPERAQGVMEVYFKTLNSAIADGGPRLEAFARFAGTTADQVRGLVEQDPTAFFRSLSNGLGSLDSVSQTAALDDLGLAGIRAGEVFGRVSANIGVFDKALVDSNSSYAEATELGSQYALVVDDIASKVQILQNQIAGLAASAGASLGPILVAALDAISHTLTNITSFMATDFGQGFAATAIVIMTVAGALLATVAAAALGTASLYAMKTAVDGLGFSAAKSGLPLLIAQLFGVSTATGVSTAGLTAFKVALVATGIGAAVVLLGVLAAAFMDTGDAAGEAFTKYVGQTGGLADALAADTAAYTAAVVSGNTELAGSYTQLNLNSEENTQKLGDNAIAISNTAKVLGLAPSAYSEATDAITGNSAALGENTTAWLKNQLMQSEAFQSLAGNAEFTDYWRTIGANMDDVIRASASGGQEAVIDYFSALEAQATKSGKDFQTALFQSTRADGSAARSFRAGLLGPGTNQGRGLSDISKTLEGFNGQLLLAGKQGKAAGAAIEQGAEGGEEAYEALGSSVDAVKAKFVTLVDYANDLNGVFQRAFDIRYSSQSAADGITTAMRAIQDGFTKADAEVASLTVSLADLQSKAGASFADTFADTFTSTLKSGFADAFSDAFDRSTAADAIILSFRSLTNAIEESRLRLQSLRADLQSLTADRSVKEYQLGVAVDYGDTLRADKLRAELAELAVKQAEAQLAIQKEQAKVGRETIGNSDAAIANRAALTGLVGQYQKYLETLADSGAETKDIVKAAAAAQQAFEEQGTALGFSNEQLSTYSAIFSSFSSATAIAQIEATRAALAAQAATQKAVADAAAALALAQDAASRSLSGNSAAAIANRAAITDLISKNQAYLTALAASGAGTGELTAESNRLRGEFIAQLQQAGLNTNAIYGYARSFDDMTATIARVPRNITINVDARTDPANAAYVEFVNRIRADAAHGVNIPISSSYDGTAAAKAGRATQLMAELAGLQKQYDAAVKSGADNVAIRALNRINVVTAALNSGGYRSGGYTGNGGVNDEAGVVHGKEFVFSAPAVRSIGVARLERAHQMAKSGQMPDFSGTSSSSGGGVFGGGGGGIQVVELTAQNLDILRNAGNVTVGLNGRTLADSSSEQNEIASRRGSN